MVSKNNRVQKMAQAAERQSHFGIRKLTVGAASVLLGTTLWLGNNANVANADTKADNNDADKAQNSENAVVNTQKVDKVVVDASNASQSTETTDQTQESSDQSQSADQAVKSNDENTADQKVAEATQNAQTHIEKATENTENKKAEITSSQADEKAQAQKIESAAQNGQKTADETNNKKDDINAGALKGAEKAEDTTNTDLQTKLDEANKKATSTADSKETKADATTTTLNTAQLSELGKANAALKNQLGASLVSWDDILSGIGQAGSAISGAINDANAAKTNDAINEAEKNFKTVDNAMDLLSAANSWDSSIQGVNLKGNINLTGDLNLTKNFIIHGLDGATLTLNGGSGSISNNAILTLDNVTVNGSVGGSGKTQIKGTVTSNVGSNTSSKANFEGSGVEVLNDATLTINRAAVGDGINLADGSTVKVDDNATLNINTNTNGATDTARYHNAGVFMEKGGNFLTGRNSTVNLNTSIGQGIAIGAGRPNSTDKDRFGGYGTGQSRQAGPTNVILGDHTTFNFTGRDGIILGNNSNFTTGDYSNVHFENKGRGVALDLANDSNINVSDHSVLYLHSVGKTSSSGPSGSYDGYNYVGVNERGNITVGEYATFRVILEGRGDNAWDDVVSLDSRSSSSNAAFTSKKGATVDIRDDNTNFYAELISFPLGNANSRVDIQDPLYVNLQRYSNGGETTGWMPVGGDEINDTSSQYTSNLIYMGGTKGVVNIGGSNYVVYQRIKSNGSKQLWLNVNSVSIPMNGFQTLDPYNNNANPDLSINGIGLTGGIRANQVHNYNGSPLTGKNAPAYGISTQRASHQIWFPHSTTTEASGTHKNIIKYVYEDGTPVTDASGNPIVKTQELDLDRQIELDLTPDALNKVQEYASTHSSDETLEFLKNNYAVSKDSGWQITNAVNTSKENPYSEVDSPVLDGYTATIQSTNAPGVTVGANGSSVTAKFQMPTEGVVENGQLTDDFKNKGITGLPENYETVVVYKKGPAEQTVTVKYYDDTTNTELTSYDKTITGVPGSDLNYTTQPSITDLENKGYDLVSDSFTSANLDGKMPENGGNYEVHVKHGTVPVNPTNPGKPGEPINPNDPDGPKYPDDTSATSLTKDVTRTIKYVDNTGKEVAPSVDQKATFTQSGVLDKVTGEWVTPLTWSEDQTVKAVTSPTVDGYHVVNVDRDADGNNVAQATLTHNDSDYTVVVTYAPDEKPATGKVVYIDDTTGTTLQTDPLKGEAGDPINYTTQSTIKDYEDKGYEFVSSNFKDGDETFKEGDANNFEVHLKHGTVPVTPENPGKPGEPINPNDPDGPKYPDDTSATSLTKDVTRTIKYVDNTGKEVSSPVTETVHFTAKGVLDKVTGEWVTPLTWSEDQTFAAQKTPVVQNYHVTGVDRDSNDNVNVDSATVNHDANDYTVIVTYAPNGHIIPVDKTTGDPIPGQDHPQFPTDPNDPSKVDNGEKPSVPGYRPETGKPGDPVEPDSQDPSKDVEVPYVKDDTQVSGQQTVHYVDSEGNKLLPDQVNDRVEFTKDGATGKWNEDSYKYKDATAPVIEGYVTSSKTVEGKTVTPEDPNAEITIVYNKVGNIVPQDPSGNPIPDPSDPSKNVPEVPYKNDPEDPTKVVPNEPVPDIPGYTPNVPSVTPEDPTKDTPVIYNKDKNPATGKVVYIDDTTGTTLQTDPLKGEAGDPINYTTQSTIKDYEDKGYEFVSSNFTDGKEVFKKGDVNNFEVHLKHGIVPVTPENPGKPGEPINPNDPDGPKYPEDSGKDNLSKEYTSTLHFQYEDGTKAADDNVQTSTWTRTLNIDKVTGEILNPDEAWKSNIDTYKNVNVPVIDGYVAMTKTKNGKAVSTYVEGDKAVQENLEDTVIYKKIGNIVPQDPNGNPIPDPSDPSKNVPEVPYKNDPNDPTKVTPNEPVPNIPGYNPNVPSVTPEDPTKDTPVVYTKDDTKVTGTQVVHYVDDQGNQLRPDEVNDSFEFIKNGTTGKWNEDTHTYKNATAPVITGYVTAAKTVEGKTVTPEDPNAEITITYHKVGKIVPVDPSGKEIPDAPTPSYQNDPEDPTKVTPNEPVPNVPGYRPNVPSVTPEDPTKDTPVPYTKDETPEAKDQIARVQYIDQDENDKIITESPELTGKPGDKIVYSTAETIKKLVDQGYVLVNDGFPTDAAFDNIDGNEQIFKVVLKHGTTPVNPSNPGKPGEPINPNDPDGPKWPEDTGKDSLTKEGKQTIHYTGAGDKTPKDNIQDTTFSHELVIDNVTGKIIQDNGWTPDSHTFTTVDTPVVDGYHADKKTAGGKTVTVDNPEVEETVTYTENGKIVPVDPEGNKIPNVDNPTYPTDPSDPTKVVPNEPVPNIPGYTPETPTVTPNDPGKDTEVVYTKPDADKGVVNVYVHDNTTGENLDQYGYTTGNVDAGTKVNYDKNSVITELTNKGYKVLNPNEVIPDEVTKGTQNITIYVEHTTTTVTPDNPGHPGDPIDPNNPDGPKYPDGTSLNDLKRTATQTVHYTGAGDKTPKDDVKSFEFTKQITFDNVTGKIIDNGSWNVSSHEFNRVDTPVVDGYHADKRIAGGMTVTPDNLKAEETVTYTENGKIVPVDPNGNKIPNVDNPTYPTDPSDPTRVTPNEPVPNIPGYTPEVPTVTPDNPGKDTPVIYTPIPADKGQVIVNVHDNTTGKDLPNYGYDSGEQEVGQKVDYNKNEVITDLTNKGYKVINPDVTIPSEVTKGSQVVTIYVEHDTVPVNPTNPGKPGEPINPNDPNGPKWPSESGNVSKDVTRTITFVDNEGKEVHAPVEQTVHFTAQGVIDKVTGKWTTPLTWSPAQTVNGQNVPFVENYHVTSISKDGEGTSSIKSVTLNHDSDSYKVVVSYEPNGHIVPVDPNGNKIPNVDNPTYPTDPNNPSKVIPNEPVPSIPGYTPEVPTVTPDNPGKDTPVIYTPIPADKGQVIVNVHDNTTGKDLPNYGYDSGEQEVGQKVDYNKNDVITELTNKGYKVINPDVTVPSEVTKGSQVVTIYVEHTTTTVTPDNPGHPGDPIDPNNPDGPKYPDGTSLDDLKKTGTQTIHYTGANNKTPKDNVQSFDFTKNITFDNVTGEIIDNGSWNVSSHEFGTVDTPVVDGYHADKRTAGGMTVTPDNLKAEDTVTYTENGKIVPVDPEGNKIPNASTPTYVTDPNDPTKVVPDEPVPTIDGYTPNQNTVTPKDPGKDTEVVYTKPDTPVTPTPEPSVTTVVGKQTITFVDGDNNNTPLRDSDVQTHTFTITDGVPSENSYTFGTVNVPVIKGYVAEIKTAGGKTVTPNDPNAEVVVVYHKIGKIVPVDPDHNPIPGAETPQYKNDPEDPTKVVPDENVPIIDGYTPSQNTVTPTDPTKDTEVVYTKKTTPVEPDEPDTPDEPDKPDKPVSPKPTNHKPAEPNYNNNIRPHSENNNWNNNIRPHSQNGDYSDTVRPHGETIDENGNIIRDGKVVGYVDKNGKKHYTTKSTLPQTGENNNEETSAAILGAAAAGIGMIGLAGVKKRRKKD